MKTTRTAATALANNIVLLGTITIAVLGLAVYLSYIAENGLPFQPTYQVNVQVANADELSKNADVRIGGARVGQILTVSPEPASSTWPHPYAQLRLQLQSSLKPLPASTHYRVRLASVLGGKYLELIPGQSHGAGVPDGGTLTLNRNARLSHELPFVDLDTALKAFGPSTAGPLRNLLRDFGEAVAGRGAQLNDALAAVARLLGPVQDVLAVLADPANRLPEFVSGAAATTQALASVAPTTTALLSDSATTFQAFDQPALGTTLDQLPPTESLATSVLTSNQPVLTEAAQVAVALRPAASLLPASADRLDAIVRAATPVFAPLPQLSVDLENALGAVEALARDPASKQVFQQLGGNDLATFGASAFVGLGAILRAAAPAQLECNAAVLWLRNFAGGLTEGDSTGPWLRSMPVFDSNDSTQAGTPAPDLHINYYPTEDGTQCQAGNETYSGKQRIGAPPPTGTVVDNTSPPPGVLQRAQKAGLVP